MRRSLSALALLLCWPAAASAAERRCPGPPSIANSGISVHRSVLVACDGRRRVVVDRAEGRGSRGRWIEAASAADRRIAWISVRRAGGRSVVVVRVARIARPRRLLRRLVVRRAPSRLDSALGVAFTTRGELAWLGGRRIVLRRPGGGRELISAGDLDGLAVEDDRTLRWRSSRTHVYRDLRPWPGNGCPRRERFRRVLSSDELLVTEAGYGGPFGGSSAVLRACVRETGRDAAVFEGTVVMGDGDLLAPIAAAGTWLVVQRSSMSRYYGCEHATVEAVEAATGARARTASIPWCDPASTPSNREAVVTERGIPAWIARHRGTARVLTAGPDHEVVELDSGGVANLRAGGPRVTWTHDGAPRSAEPG